jgi:hypothetical protein
MKKLIVILSLVASLQIYAADGGRDPRDESDPFGRQFISHSFLSPEDRARFDQDFDAFLTGTDPIQSSLPEGPMSVPGGGMNSAAQAALASRVVQSGLPHGVYQIEHLPDGFSTALFMLDESENERPVTPVHQVDRIVVHGTPCTPEAPLVRQTAEQDPESATLGSLTDGRERSDSLEDYDDTVLRNNTRPRSNSDAGSGDDFTGNPV